MVQLPGLISHSKTIGDGFEHYDWGFVPKKSESGLNAVRLSEISVRPELVEGFYINSWWFDRLTTNGKSNSIESGLAYYILKLFLDVKRKA